MTKGTPKTLLQAIHNGLEECHYEREGDATFLKAHVKDFLSQKFCTAFFGSQSDEETLRLKKLWEKITND